MLALRYWKLIAGAAMIVAVGTGVWLAWNHYEGLLEERDTLKTNVASLEMALDAQQEANKQTLARLNEFAEALAKQQRTMEALAHQSAVTAAESRRMSDVLAQHDFERLLAAKPGLTLRAVNRGTADVLRMLECSTSPSGCEGAGPAYAE